MHEEYDDNYDDSHDYDDSQDSLENKYKHYFKFDPAAWDAWSKIFYDSLNSIENTLSTNTWYVTNLDGFPTYSFPVNSYFSNTGKGDSFQYLGNNYQNSPIWKTKYFIYNPLSIEYLNHIKNNAVHFVQQPHYYKGMFDILN